MCRRRGRRRGRFGNKGRHGVQPRIAVVERGLPFAILGFDRDSGGEFTLNAFALKAEHRHADEERLHDVGRT